MRPHDGHQTDLSRIRLRVLADQDEAIDRKVPFVGAFCVSAAGQATFLLDTGVWHLDSVLTERSDDGWMPHLIGRRSGGA